MKTQLNIFKKILSDVDPEQQLPMGEAISDLENIPNLEVKYRGKKSKKGTYYPYDVQPNKWGIVGMIYFPVDKEITDLYVYSPVRQEVLAGKKGKKK